MWFHFISSPTPSAGCQGVGRMDHKRISELKLGELAQGFFLIKNVEVKSSSNNSRYLDLVLADQTGEINAKLWDCSEEDEATFIRHRLVKVRGTVVQWQKRPQLRVEKIRLAAEPDGIDPADFVPVAPEEPQFMYRELLKYIEKIENRDINRIVSRIVEESRERLLTHPAAVQNHHAERSGLLHHIYKMLLAGERMCQVYPSLNRDLLYAGIILHDIAKLEEIEANDLGLVSDYTTEGYLLGHIVQGIKKVDRAAREIGADQEIAVLLQHMILSHHYEPEFGSPRRPMFPEAEMLHYLDLIDARMYDMDKALRGVAAKGFSDRVWVLHNRRLYKANVEPASPSPEDEEEAF